MYFEFEDNHPDTPRLDGPLSRRESFVYSVTAHVVFFLALVFGPRIPFVQQLMQQANAEAQAAQQLALQREREQERPRFVFVQPRVEMPTPKPPPRFELSDRDRMAMTIERPPNPTNPLPFARGNTSDRVEAERQEERPRGQGPGDQPSLSQDSSATGQAEEQDPLPQSDAGRTAYQRPETSSQTAPSGGALGQALRNLQRYVQHDSFDNPQGGGGAYGPSIQFDTKGVEFGPWIRRFIAQIKRNWFIPYAAMSFKGHVVVTFNVHKNGAISDLQVVQPSSVDAFNSSATGALLASNPTQPLPPEYPADKAFFTITFYYNENPPSQ